MNQIVRFKTRATRARDWLAEVIHNIFGKKSRNLEHMRTAVLMWEDYDKEAKCSIMRHAYFNCSVEDMEDYKNYFAKLANRELVHEYLRKHISDFIEFVEE